MPVPTSFLDRRRTQLRLLFAILATAWTASLFLLPPGGISRAALGVYLLLPLGVASLLLTLWWDTWFHLGRHGSLPLPLARGFFAISAVAMLIVFGALYVLFVFPA